MSDNIDNMQEAIKQINICNRCVRAYEDTKIIIAEEEIEIPDEIITALKQRFVAARTACKNALNAVSS